jgi:hypothetical protein
MKRGQFGMLYLLVSLGILYLVATTVCAFGSKSVFDGYATAVAAVVTLIAAGTLFCLCEPIWRIINWFAAWRCFRHWRTQ